MWVFSHIHKYILKREYLFRDNVKCRFKLQPIRETEEAGKPQGFDSFERIPRYIGLSCVLNCIKGKN